MIVLDTNVISSQMSVRPDPLVHEWLNAQEQSDLYLACITISELHFGAWLVDDQVRRDGLLQAIGRIQSAYQTRLLDFTSSIASVHGKLAAMGRRAGRPIKTKDAMIAAICLYHGAALATRNVKDFMGLDLTVTNPFEAG